MGFSFFLSMGETIMAKQRLLAVIILALVLAVTFNSGSDFVGARNPASKSTTGRMAVLGKDSQERYRFLVDGAVPEPPPPPKGILVWRDNDWRLHRPDRLLSALQAYVISISMSLRQPLPVR